MSVEGTAAPPVPDWLGAVVDRGGLAVCAFDASLTLVYMNRAATDLLGVDPGSMLGRSALELVHPEDLSRAATAVSAAGTGARLGPGLLRVRRSDGAHPLVEVTPTLVPLPEPPDGPGPLTVVVIRDLALHDAHWRFLRAISRGEPFHHCLDLLARGLSTEIDGPLAISYEADGARRVAGALPPELAGVDERGNLDLTPGAPWAEAAETGNAAWCPVAELPERVRVQAAAAGFRSCAVVPVPDPRGRPLLLVQWPVQDGLEQVVIETLSRRPREAVMLALERQESLARLEHLARHDGLTGLVNRGHFFDLLDDAAASGLPCGVCYVDLDHLKPVNDTHGHQAGDEVLEICARRLEAVTRSEDIVARLGGDEFAIASPGITEPRLEELAATIVEVLAQPMEVRDLEVQVGASVGCAVLQPGQPVDPVLAAADEALYAAKRVGRGTWRRAGA